MLWPKGHFVGRLPSVSSLDTPAAAVIKEKGITTGCASGSFVYHFLIPTVVNASLHSPCMPVNVASNSSSCPPGETLTDSGRKRVPNSFQISEEMSYVALSAHARTKTNINQHCGDECHHERKQKSDG